MSKIPEYKRVLSDARRIAALMDEAACPCCHGTSAAQPCQECHSTGLASVAYDTVRTHYKRSEELRTLLLEAVIDALAFLDRPDITTYEWYKLAPDHISKFRHAIAKAKQTT